MKYTDTRHFGLIPYVEIETDTCTVVIKGKNKKKIKSAEEVMFFSCTGKGITHVKVLNQTKGMMTAKSPLEPLFFENEIYQITVVSKNETSLFVNHDSKAVEQSFQAVGFPYILTGNISFQNEVGYSTFHVYSEIEKELSFTLEIFPSKMSYKTDYVRMVDEVNGHIHDLAYDMLRKTYIEAKSVWSKQATWTEFYHVLSHYMKPFLHSVRQIENQPFQSVKVEHELMRGDQIKKQDSRAISFVRTHPTYLTSSSRGIKINRHIKVVPTKAMGTRHVATYDNLENQSVKWMMTQLYHKLTTLIDKLIEDRYVKKEAVAALETNHTELKRLLNNVFWQRVKTIQVSTLPSTLRTAPRYREASRYFMFLTRGLALNGEFYHLSLKDIATLYEYWTYVSLVKKLQTYGKRIEQNIMTTTEQGLNVRMQASYHCFQVGKAEITLWYQKEYHHTHTVIQKPDLLLEVKQGEKKSVYLFDAKYRIKPNHDTPSPREEDINTMHRYRDAIVEENGIKPVQTAIVLFPGKAEGYKQHHFYKSIERVGVGALPFLPGEEGLVEEFIETICTEEPNFFSAD
ncbi:DUF2357 domain-containing protein [Priestia megaterium]|uniref:DUF2357 domain-containing protein n=1 Tax=Priestia megaterium TaxID=1404 RepID=UPI003EEC95AA